MENMEERSFIEWLNYLRVSPEDRERRVKILDDFKIQPRIGCVYCGSGILVGKYGIHVDKCRERHYSDIDRRFGG